MCNKYSERETKTTEVKTKLKTWKLISAADANAKQMLKI